MIKLTKIKNSDSPLYVGHILVGYEKTGKLVDPIVVGQSVVLRTERGFFSTSTVQSIDETNQTFVTVNSIYKWENINS